MSRKKFIILTIIAVVGVVLIALGTSYALFTFNVTKNSNFKISVGSLELSITDTNSEDRIIVNNLEPKKDSIALSEDGYTFTITNTGSLDAYYTVYLEDIIPNGETKTRIANNLMHVNLSTSSTADSSNSKLISALNGGVLTTGTLSAGDSINYTLRLWLDYNAGNEAQNKYFASRIRIDSTQTAATSTVTFNPNGGEIISNTKTVSYMTPYGELPTPVKYDIENNVLLSKYEFVGWNTKPDGTGDTITASSIFSENSGTNLYAIWNDQFTVTIYNGESLTPIVRTYNAGDVIDITATNVDGKQFLYWEVDGEKRAYDNELSMYMYKGKDITIRAIYGNSGEPVDKQPGAFISDIYKQYSNNKIAIRSYSYMPNGYQIVKSGIIATLDENIANGIFDDTTATYVRGSSGNVLNYYFTWNKSSLTAAQTLYVKAYLIYKDTNNVEHTIYGDLVTTTLAE
jgi:hypothetical protein